MEQVTQNLIPMPIRAGDAVPFRMRHLHWIEQKLNAI
jgi:hypothetical protein